MSNICSVLSNKRNIKFADIPYPHLIIDNALPTKYYEELNQAFPAYDKIIKSDAINSGKYKENFAYRYNASKSLIDREIPNIWREFISFHTSFKFVEDFYNIFNSSINKFYPDSHENYQMKTIQALDLQVITILIWIVNLLSIHPQKEKHQ